MDDTLASGKTLRTLYIIDNFNREVLSITVDNSLPSQRVIREVETLVDWRGKPDAIKSDNGPEFLSVALWIGAKSIAKGGFIFSLASQHRTV